MSLVEKNGIIADEQVTELLRSLPRAEAPGDFESRVRGRIARGTSGPRNTSRLWLRYALPALLAVLVSAVAVNVYVSRPDETGTAEPTPDVSPATAPPGPDVPARLPSNVLAESATPLPAPVVDSHADKRRSGVRSVSMPARHKASTVPAGFVKDSAVRKGKDPIILKDVDPTTGNLASPGNDFPTSGPLNVSALLQLMGIDGEKAEGGWKVKSNRSGSMAERSGVKAGDIIESIDDKPLTDGSPFNSISFGSLQVVREGKRVRLPIRNK